MTIYEPSTLITDVLLAVWSGGLAWRLGKGANACVPAARWWSRTLALTAGSALVGGTYHGFGPNFPQYEPVWWIAVLGIITGVSVTLALALLADLLPPEQQRSWKVMIAAKCVIFATLILWNPVFVIAIADYGSTLIAWIVAAFWLRRPWRSWMLLGIALSVVAALVQIMRLSPAAGFNSNDLYHVIQALALGAFYKGAGRLQVAY